MITAFEKKLAQSIETHMVGATPGLQIQVFLTGKKVCDLSLGKTYPYYDLASLTKLIFTTQAMMRAFDEGLWNLESKVSDFVPWFKHPEVRIADCLTHSSGLPWWFPFYKNMDLNSPREKRWEESGKLISEMHLQPSEVSVYSDVGFILLGHVLEALYKRDLFSLWQNIQNFSYPRLTLNFHPDNKPLFSPDYYAPTERCPWRGKIIQGEVHDDNAWALGGVSPHAGLFGSIDDVSWYGLLLRSQVTGFSKNSMRLKTAKLFSTRARGLGKGDWALGFMMPTQNFSSSGKYFSPASIGHTGFTGTSLWYDPAQDLLVVILSNRVFFGRELKHFQELRPQIHNWVIEGLRRS
jgi:CubicO group peptidase (beta-lactamase class C family)